MIYAHVCWCLYGNFWVCLCLSVWVESIFVLVCRLERGKKSGNECRMKLKNFNLGGSSWEFKSVYPHRRNSWQVGEEMENCWRRENGRTGKGNRKRREFQERIFWPEKNWCKIPWQVKGWRSKQGYSYRDSTALVKQLNDLHLFVDKLFSYT